MGFASLYPSYGPLRRQSDARNLLGQIMARTNFFQQGAEIGAGFEALVDARRIEEYADRIFGECSGRPHVLGRQLPIGKIVALQFNVVGLGVLIVDRDRQAMIDAERRLDAGLAQTVVRRHQVSEARVFERTMVHPVVTDLVGVVSETGHSQECDPMVCLVIRRPGGHFVSELHLRAENKTIPFDHLVEAAGFHRHVVERGSDDGRGSCHGFLLFAAECSRQAAAQRGYQAGRDGGSFSGSIEPDIADLGGHRVAMSPKHPRIPPALPQLAGS